MEIMIQFVQAETSNHAHNLAMDRLEKLAKKYDWLIRAEVFFKALNNNHGKGKKCEIELSCPGPRIFASSTEDSFETALTETINDLDILLKKRKSKMKKHS